MAQTETITIRVPKGFKAKMKKRRINLSQDIRSYIEKRMMAVEMLDLLVEIRKKAKKRKVNGDSTDIIREYRDSR